MASKTERDAAIGWASQIVRRGGLRATEASKVTPRVDHLVALERIAFFEPQQDEVAEMMRQIARDALASAEKDS